MNESLRTWTQWSNKCRKLLRDRHPYNLDTQYLTLRDRSLDRPESPITITGIHTVYQAIPMATQYVKFLYGQAVQIASQKKRRPAGRLPVSS